METGRYPEKKAAGSQELNESRGGLLLLCSARIDFQPRCSVSDAGIPFARLIKEEESLAKEHVTYDFTTSYWEKRYTLRPRHIAHFLVPCADKVRARGCAGARVRGEPTRVPPP